MTRRVCDWRHKSHNFRRLVLLDHESPFRPYRKQKAVEDLGCLAPISIFFDPDDPLHPD